MQFAGGSIFHEAASPDAQEGSPADPEGALTIQGVRIAHNSMGKVNTAPACSSTAQTHAFRTPGVSRTGETALGPSFGSWDHLGTASHSSAPCCRLSARKPSSR